MALEKWKIHIKSNFNFLSYSSKYFWDFSTLTFNSSSSAPLQSPHSQGHILGHHHLKQLKFPTDYSPHHSKNLTPLLLIPLILKLTGVSDALTTSTFLEVIIHSPPHPSSAMSLSKYLLIQPRLYGTSFQQISYQKSIPSAPALLTKAFLRPIICPLCSCAQIPED